MTTNNEVTTVRLPPELKRLAEKQAAAEDRSLSKFIERAVRAALADVKAKK